MVTFSIPAAWLAEAEVLALADTDSEVEAEATWLAEAERLPDTLWLPDAEAETKPDVLALALSDADSETF